MTLKQRLAELLPHFDDDGKLLPNKKMTVKQNPLGGFRASTVCDLQAVAINIIAGYEYRIEDLPKRPREWTIWAGRFNGKIYQYFDAAPMGITLDEIKVIEDTGPREVTDADVEQACADFYGDRWPSIDSPLHRMHARKAIQHYENERGK